MRREFHVRFCEGLGVRFPRATRLVILVDSHPRHRWLRKAVEQATSGGVGQAASGGERGEEPAGGPDERRELRIPRL